MVIRPAAPSGYSLFNPLKTSPKRRMTPTSMVVLGAVAFAHLGLAVYLYGAHLAPSRLATLPDPAPVVIDLTRLTPDPPATPADRIKARPLPLHEVKRVTLQADQKIEVQPRPDTQEAPDNGKVSLLPSDGGAIAETAKPSVSPPVITNPHWLRQPTADEFADAYPQRALIAGKSGFASLACTVMATGALTDCSVAEETPAGWGFGAAALSLAKRFRLVPRQEDGRPTGGAMIRIPIRFVLPG